MSLQYDLVPGFDLSSLSSATQEQIMQALSQLSPVLNIGGIIYSSTTPDVLNNPRFSRYLWIDSTDPTNLVFKKYDVVAGIGSWNTFGVANAAIVAAMLANNSVSVLRDDGSTPKIALRTDAAADLTKALFILRVTSDGKNVEPVSIDTAIAASGAGTVALNRISVGGGSDYYLLSVLGGVLAYRVFDPTNMINAGALPASKIATGTPYYVLAYNAGGVATALQFDPTNMISATDANRVPLTKLQGLASGAATNDVIAFDGTNWVKKTPPLVSIYNNLDGTAAYAVDTYYTFAHGLGVIPTIVQIYFECISTEGNYVAGDRIPVVQIFNNSAASNSIMYCLDATNIKVWIPSALSTIGIRYLNKTAANTIFTLSLTGTTKWNLRVIASA